MKIKFKRFTRPQVLKRLGRELLTQFFARFESELRTSALALPAPELADLAFFGALARLLSAPEALPEGLTEALFAIDEMASPEGQEQLELACVQAGVALNAAASREDIALQVWLANPALLARTHNQQRLRRLSRFEHFGPRTAPAEAPPFSPPNQTTLDALAAALDPWFVRHQRGQNTTRLELYPLEGEYWFLVRHGDTFTRAPAVEAQQTEIIHFRPERDDVIVYTPRHDEIRVNARTRGERNLYVKTFGRCLRRSEDYFNWRWTYTLEPLRTEGPAALDPAGIDGIQKIVLRELEVAWHHDPLRPRLIREAGNLFEYAGANGLAARLIPEDGQIVSAGFEFHFTDSPKPRPVQIRLPNILKLGRHCDAQLVDRLLCRAGFRVAKLAA